MAVQRWLPLLVLFASVDALLFLRSFHHRSMQAFGQVLNSEFLVDIYGKSKISSQHNRVFRSLAESATLYCTKWNAMGCPVSVPEWPPKNDSQLFFWVPTKWGPCSIPCGRGIQKADIDCFNASLTKVDASNCIHLPYPDIFQMCNAVSCLSYSLFWLPWSDCNTSCGTGYKSRRAICVDSLGNIARAENCGIEEGFTEWKMCLNPPCDLPYWDISTWGRCSVICGGGMMIRNSTCMSGGFPSSVDACEMYSPFTEETCNSHPCQTHSWLVGPLSACEGNRCNETVDRLVQCVDGNGENVSKFMCGEDEPLNYSSCNNKNISCDDCQYRDCSENGICQGGVCECFEGWEGIHCEKMVICDGYLGYRSIPSVDCCSLVDANQHCCGNYSAKLDKNGNCCESGILDACGTCNGKAIAMDFVNYCCETLRDEKGICCKSGFLDECNICDGDNSCRTLLQLDLRVDSNSIIITTDEAWNSAVQDIKIASRLFIQGSAISVSSTEFGTLMQETASTRNTMHINLTLFLAPHDVTFTREKVKASIRIGILQKSTMNMEMETVQTSLVSLNSVTRFGSCGNGICEIGERCTPQGDSATLGSSSCCQEDCPYVSLSCPIALYGPRLNKVCSGNGICFDATGQCSCFKGYSGIDCSMCSEGWLFVEDGACVKNADSKTLRNLAISYTSRNSLDTNQTPSSHISSSPAGIVVVALVTILLILFGAALLNQTLKARRKRRAKQPPPVSAPDDPTTPKEFVWTVDVEGTKPKASWGTSSSYDYDNIPITPLPKSGYKRRPYQSDNNNNESHLATLELHSTQSRVQELNLSSCASPRAILMNDEDFTEEEQSQIIGSKKQGLLNRVRTLGRPSTTRIISDYLSESEGDESDSEENPKKGLNTHLASTIARVDLI